MLVLLPRSWPLDTLAAANLRKIRAPAHYCRQKNNLRTLEISRSAPVAPTAPQKRFRGPPKRPQTFREAPQEFSEAIQKLPDIQCSSYGHVHSSKHSNDQTFTIQTFTHAVIQVSNRDIQTSRYLDTQTSTHADIANSALGLLAHLVEIPGSPETFSAAPWGISVAC